MPEELKNKPDSAQFEKYLQKFMRRKLSQHRVKAVKQTVQSLASVVVL